MHGLTTRSTWCASALMLTPAVLLAMTWELAGPAGQAVRRDGRCASADQAVATRLRSWTDRADERNTRAIDQAMSRLTSARADCAQGRIERGLDQYAAVQRTLPSNTGSMGSLIPRLSQ